MWDYAGANGFGSDRSEQLEMHPTVKPVALVADALRDCSKRGGLILDPFVGSGTTLVAAERTGRVACGLELDPLYIDTANGLRRSAMECISQPPQRVERHETACIAADDKWPSPAKSFASNSGDRLRIERKNKFS